MGLLQDFAMKKRMKYAGFAGFEFDNPKSNELVFAVGKLIMNFGAVESLTYYLISRLSEDSDDHDNALDQLFVKRFNLIKHLAQQQNMPDQIRSDIEMITVSVKVLADFRNKIAHNPIVLRRNDDNIEHGPSSFSIIDMKSQKGRGKSIVDVVTIERLNKGIDAVIELATNLQSILDSVGVEMDERTQG